MTLQGLPVSNFLISILIIKNGWKNISRNLQRLILIILGAGPQNDRLTGNNQILFLP
jgi:hypothetical protein